MKLHLLLLALAAPVVVLAQPRCPAATDARDGRVVQAVETGC